MESNKFQNAAADWRCGTIPVAFPCGCGCVVISHNAWFHSVKDAESVPCGNALDCDVKRMCKIIHSLICVLYNYHPEKLK